MLKRYETESGAKSALTRKWRKRYPQARVVSQHTFNTEIDHDVKVKNLMNGAEVTLRASEVGTCIDPSTELFWSM